MYKKTVNKVYYGAYLLVVLIGTICNYFRDTDKEISKPALIAMTVGMLIAAPLFLVFAGMKIKMILDKSAEEDSEGCAVLTDAEEWL